MASEFRLQLPSCFLAAVAVAVLVGCRESPGPTQSAEALPQEARTAASAMVALQLLDGDRYSARETSDAVVLLTDYLRTGYSMSIPDSQLEELLVSQASSLVTDHPRLLSGEYETYFNAIRPQIKAMTKRQVENLHDYLAALNALETNAYGHGAGNEQFIHRRVNMFIDLRLISPHIGADVPESEIAASLANVNRILDRCGIHFGKP